MMGEDSLNGYTSLTGISKPTNRASLCGNVHVGIGLYDHARVPAEFQHHFLLSALSLQHPSHSGAAGKAQEFEARIDDELLCDRIVAGDNIDGARRKSCLQNHFAQE